MAPNSSHIPTVANHIAKYLNTPDIIFVQEIQDDSGPTDDGVVSANLTLTTLVDAIQNESGILYSFVDIAPVDKQDGGQPGGNIRQAFLLAPWCIPLLPLTYPPTPLRYQTEKVKLRPGTPGGPLDSTSVRKDKGKLSLTYSYSRFRHPNAR